MTPREKAISVLGQYFPMVSDMNIELINSIIDAAHEGMVDEKRVKEIVMEADIATRKAFAKFVDQRLSAHRNEEHLPGGGMRRNAEPYETNTVIGTDENLYNIGTAGDPSPEHYAGEPCNLSVWHDSVEAAKGLQFEYAEKRQYHKNEWICTSTHSGIMLSNHEGAVHDPCWILRPVPDTANSKQVFLSTEQAEAVIQALQDEYGGYNDKYTARDARAVYSLVDPDVESSKPSPAPWMPKVGELVAIKFNNLITKVIYREGLRCDLEYSDGSKGTVGVDSVRPVRASDWIVEVEGFGKVEAWYDEEGYLVISIAGELDCWPEDRALYTIILDWLRAYNVPIKPFGWKEGE